MNYFVTGATGFVGRFLLAQLLERPDAQVYALVRPASQARFVAGLTRYGDAAARVHCVPGDLAHPTLVLDRADLPEHIDHVFHLAAIYDMAMSEEEAAEINERGTERVVDFVNGLEGPVTLHHVSSVAVAGPFVSGVYHESDFDVGQALDHPYYQSKFEAERIVRTRATVPVRVLRPGIVVGDSKRGEYAKIDGPYYFFALVRLVARWLPRWLPLLCIEGGRMPLVPVDYVARAMVAIAHAAPADEQTSSFTLVAHDPPSVGALVQRLFELAHGPRVFRLRVPVLARIANRMARFGGRLVPGWLARAVTRVTSIPASVYSQVFTQTVYDDSNARALLEPLGVSCPPFEEFSAPMWEGWVRAQ
ncbi:MAG: SDR family oxidoreductase [Polyangiales bacterium]|nr:SDR family oxidoreductase [Myxococcales bacterium]MCB9660473.1 SDR family oxidoreductase [Sandaracinaceae bacterium]